MNEIHKKECKGCGELFTSEYSTRIYCSDDCRAKASQRTKNESRKRKRLIVREMNGEKQAIRGNCKHCGKEYTTRKVWL
jgi:hypothetical protein|tara:strand:+ start:278 stop:514 length:237 start_codon:yes stop_codon:yes gene_type:complete